MEVLYRRYNSVVQIHDDVYLEKRRLFMCRSKIPSFIFRVAIGIAVFALALTLAGRPTSASAASLSQANNPHLTGVYNGSKPRPAGTNLVYQGGAVETTPLVYISWWGNQWNTGFSTGGYSSAKAQTYITGFFSNVGGSSWDNINTQYCEGVAIGTTNCGSSGTHITNPTGHLAD